MSCLQDGDQIVSTARPATHKVLLLKDTITYQPTVFSCLLALLELQEKTGESKLVGVNKMIQLKVWVK